MEKNLSALEDSELLEPVRRGDPDAFLELSTRYLGLLRARAADLAGRGGPEREDLLQEGLIGLYLAATSYREDRGASFRTYAGVCVRNCMADAVRRHVGPGNRPLNQALSLEGEDAPAPAETGPESLVELREQARALLERLESILSPLERRVLGMYLRGLSREEIPARTGLSLKAYDNALYRVRQKLKGSV